MLPWKFTSAATRLGVMLAMKALVSKDKLISPIIILIIIINRSM